MHHLHTVLLVDDETTIRDGLKHMIRWEQEGFRLLEMQQTDRRL